MGIFDQLIASAQSAGIFAFYLPFLIVFALMYGLLARIGLFGPAGRMTNGLNAIIAFSIALFVIGFTPAGITISKFFGSFFSQSTMAIVTVVVGLIVLVLVGETIGPGIIRQTDKGPVLVGRGFEFGKWVALVATLVVIGVFINSGGIQALGVPATGGFLGLSGQDMVILAFIVITVLLIYWVSGEKK